MTILCSAEFAEAAQFAAQADDALEATILSTGDVKRRKELEQKRGQGVKTLLACFMNLARSDAIYNNDPHFPGDSEVEFLDGRRYTIASLGKYRLPLREVFVYHDLAPHSFFFKEDWLDRDTRQPVTVYDRCWYIFNDGTTQAAADAMAADELDRAVREELATRTFFADEMTKAAFAKKVVRETLRHRQGMCGGVIYHADYGIDGKAMPYGSWSTHT
jgi:hypothetical protein